MIEDCNINRRGNWRGNAFKSEIGYTDQPCHCGIISHAKLAKTNAKMR